MRILYVWDKPEIPDTRKACVTGTLSLYPDAEAFCITKAPKFMGMKVIPWMEVLGKMKAFFGFQKTPYAWNNPMCFSDWARFWFLANNDNTLYLDTDCRMKARFDFETNGAFVQSDGNICLLYAPKGWNGNSLLLKLKDRARERVNLLYDFRSKLDAEKLPVWWYSHGVKKWN